DDIRDHSHRVQEINSDKRLAYEKNLRSNRFHYESGELAISDFETNLYLAMEMFDRKAISIIESMKVFCKEKIRLKGSMIIDGVPINVTIGQFIVHGKKPYWGITAIERWYNPRDLNEFKVTLQNEYPEISFDDKTDEFTTASFHNRSITHVLFLYLSEVDEFYFANLREYEYCREYNRQNI